MRKLPVYPCCNGSFTFADNGEYPTPFHLLPPQTAWRLAAGLTDAERNQMGLSYESVAELPGQLSLCLDGEVVCSMLDGLCFDAEELRMFAANSKALNKEALTKALTPAISARQAACKRERFERLIEAVQKLGHQLPESRVRVWMAEEYRDAEVALSYPQEYALWYQHITLITDALSLCDSVGVECMDNRVQVCFSVDDCAAAK